MFVRAVAYASIREFVPFYGLYVLLFEDHELGAGSISSLFVLWSVVAFVSEVPSGAWADTVSRRALLAGSGVLLTAAFTMWLVWPTYWGFAAGFALWGLSESLKSGTFEALVYDGLAARGGEHRYAAVMGYAAAGEMVCVFAATLSAAPLFGLGGYALVGWTSVAITVAGTLLVFTLPAAPKSMEADEIDGPGDTLAARYLASLRDGTNEVRTDSAVCRAVVLTAALLACLAFDEYFGLLAREDGASTEFVPVLVALTVVGQVVGAATAGRGAQMRGRAMGVIVTIGALALALGALAGGVGGFVAIGLGYGALHHTAIVAEARLQETMSGRARATVSSVVGVTSEMVSVAIFTGFALGSVWLPVAILVAAATMPLFVLGAVAGRMLPSAAKGEPSGSP
ncbi:MFS transporter [Rhodococcus sp. DT1]|uniref:MFS transporter n=1 Tax=Rhodococcus sp. DT1 TaxID=3416544 RepID=UPI003CEFED88